MISAILMKELISIPRTGIWALINEDDRKVFLSFSNAVAGSLMRNLGDLKDGSHRHKNMVADLSKLSFKMLEEFDGNAVENRLRINYWSDWFKARGFELYNPGVSIKLVIEKQIKFHPPGIMVLLRNTRYKKITLGLFPTEEDADRFIETHYRDGVYNIIKDGGDLSQILFKRLENESNGLA